jgi:hypothetical protein
LFSGSSDGGEKAKACSPLARPYTKPLLLVADVGWRCLMRGRAFRRK